MKTVKPKVTTNPGANAYSGRDERIIEFSHPDAGGGLISFTVIYGAPEEAPRLSVHVYRFDETVDVSYQGQAL